MFEGLIDGGGVSVTNLPRMTPQPAEMEIQYLAQLAWMEKRLKKTTIASPENDSEREEPGQRLPKSGMEFCAVVSCVFVPKKLKETRRRIRERYLLIVNIQTDNQKINGRSNYQPLNGDISYRTRVPRYSRYCRTRRAHVFAPQQYTAPGDKYWQPPPQSIMVPFCGRRVVGICQCL
ncbi:predicted protein [Histoplasma capsulatum var. duboisii H88]|uniref:Predicted protein n=1 Tax=Ajellomyces capsulatus (strain H88) TaxID=544711 RepID=F0UFL3_AJEC8|nr:predicted protein [Histoplasma capsulatum var. duboisii H88]